MEIGWDRQRNFYKNVLVVGEEGHCYEEEIVKHW